MVVSLAVASMVIAVPALGQAAPATAHCSTPAVGEDFDRRAAADLGVDHTRLDAALAHAARTGGFAAQVYRGGCLLGAHTAAGEQLLPAYSVSKGVTALAVGRAVTLGHFGVDDPISAFFPEADAAHGAITVRQILTQTSGLRFGWGPDAAALGNNQVQHSLNLPFDFAPGTTFQYAQAILALLPRIIETTTGTSFEDFIQRELFSPLGIEPGQWRWQSDRSGTPVASGGLRIGPTALARIGHLLLGEGTWTGQQLISADYLRQLRAPTEANGGYGFLTWTNAGDWHMGVEVPSSQRHERPTFESAPRDTYAFVGALGQFVVVVPSLDVVIVRMGVPTQVNLSNPVSTISGMSNPDIKEFFRQVFAAVEG